MKTIDLYDNIKAKMRLNLSDNYVEYDKGEFYIPGHFLSVEDMRKLVDWAQRIMSEDRTGI